jgi:phage protein D
MAQTPFYKVMVKSTQRDISDLITKFSHELATDQDNLLVLNINRVSPDLVDEADFQEGSILSFQYGYSSGKTSQVYLARISDVISSYGEIIDITIRATDLGIVLKKSSSKQIWQNVRSSDIVTKIAIANGLKPVVDQTDTVHKNMPQGGKTDYDFVKYLTTIEKDGSWRFYLRGDEMHFTRLKLEQPSSKTLRWNYGEGNVRSFKPYSQETLKQAASRDTIVQAVDPFTNKVVQNVVNNTSSQAPDDIKLGEYVYDFNANQQTYKPQLQGKQSTFNLNANARPSQVQKAQQDTNRASVHVYSASSSVTEVRNVASKKKKKASMFDYMATLLLEGDPDYIEDQVMSITGVSKKDTGNWYVSRVTHAITPDSSYTTRMTWNKNAGKKPIGNTTKAKADTVNKTVGPEQKADTPVKKEVGVYVYDKDANLISSPNKK